MRHRARRDLASPALRIAVVLAVVASALTTAALPFRPAGAAEDTSVVDAVGSAWSESPDGRSSVTVDRPAGTQPGHVLVATVAVNGGSDGIATPAEWSRLRDDKARNDVGQAIFVRVATNAEPASYTFSVSGKPQAAAGITAYSGVEPSSPVEAHGALTSDDGLVTAPSLPASTAGARLLNITAANADGTVAPPPAMTERFEANSPHPKNHKDVLVALADEAVGTAGATGPRTAIVSPAGPAVGAALVLRPAGSLPLPPPPPPPPPDEPDGDAVLVGAGDIASCHNDNDEATARLVDGVVARHPQARVFTLGDNVYDNGTDQEFNDCYDPTWGRHKARTRPAPGNHEYGTSGAAGYFNYFGAAAGPAGQGYYDYMEGGWHVVVLNSQCNAVGGCHAGSSQEQWLRARLAEVAAECTVAMWHHPLFSSGGVHGSNLATEPLWQALYDHGAELILNGHDHLYERFAPQTATGVLDTTYGVRQITAGLGGRSRYGFSSTLAPNSEVRYSADYGVLKLTLRSGGYDFEMLRSGDASVVDSGAGSCHAAPPVVTPPPPPPPVDGPIDAVGSSFSESSTSQRTLTLARPAGVGAGHVMVAQIVSNDDDPGFVAPAGWTLVSDLSIVNDLRQAVYYRAATGSEPSSYTWALDTDTSRRLAGGLTAYSGVDTTNPLDGHAAWVQEAPSLTVTAPSLDASVPDTRLLHLAAVNAEGTIAPPDGMIERWEASSPNSKNDRDALAALADLGLGSAGGTGDRIATTTQAGPSIGLALLLRPAPAS